MSVVLLLLTLVLLSVVYRICFPAKFHLVKHFSGPPLVPFFGNFLDIIKNKTPKGIADTTRVWHSAYASPVRVKILGYWGVRVFKADQMELLLKSKSNLTKGKPLYTFLQPWLGLGLLTSTGAQWSHQRKLLTPSFHFGILKQFVAIFNDHSLAFVDYIRREGEKEEIDVRGPLSLSTLDMIGETSMGTNLRALEGGANREYIAAIHRFAETPAYRVGRPWLHNETIFQTFSAKGRAVAKDIKLLHAFTNKVIEERERSADETEAKGSGRRLALLDMLLEMKRKGQMSAREVREQVDTFMFEGHDTTATGMVYILFCLATHKNMQKMAVEEVDSVFREFRSTVTFASINSASPSSDHLTYEALNDRLPYLDRFMKEVQRVFPSAPIIARTLDEDITLADGKIIPSNSTVELHIHSLHRDADQFPDPLRFDPDRFLPDEAAKRHPFAYVPFSAGPRNCIGQKFAQLEMKAMTVQLLRNFELHSTQTAEDIECVLSIVLRPNRPVNIRFTPRC